MSKKRPTCACCVEKVTCFWGVLRQINDQLEQCMGKVTCAGISGTQVNSSRRANVFDILPETVDHPADVAPAEVPKSNGSNAKTGNEEDTAEEQPAKQKKEENCTEGSNPGKASRGNSKNLKRRARTEEHSPYKTATTTKCDAINHCRGLPKQWVEASTSTSQRPHKSRKSTHPNSNSADSASQFANKEKKFEVVHRLFGLAWPNGLRPLAEFEFGGAGGRGVACDVAWLVLGYILTATILSITLQQYPATLYFSTYYVPDIPIIVPAVVDCRPPIDLE
ncbi:hypothetical protein B0H11DRAFT_1941132 [Mycena galericulata]|nr:hypothetical protein B0H11DRAFT_1941132 [Mycena galericulata]